VEYVDVARALTERGEIVLRRRFDDDEPEHTGGVLELRVNGVFVVDSFENSTEVALAGAALAEAADPRHVLVGGLGLGFTAHEVLSDHRVERVTVAEIEEPLVQWFRDGRIPHGPAYLADGRLGVAVADVQQVVTESPPGTFDLVLLDVDNGPDFLVFESNAAIYEKVFLRQVETTLRPDGTLVIWSSTESPQLAESLRSVFGNSTTQSLPVTLQGRDETYYLHCATKQATR
jgi:spermidine synthase